MSEATTAPDFTLEDQQGKKVHLYDELKSGPALVAFYPGDFTPVCTKQLCSYSDNIASFRRFGVQVFAISSDSNASHAKFAAKHQFPFPLLADPRKTVANAYGCKSLFMLGNTSRAVFIVSAKKEILYRYVEPTVLTHRNADDLTKVLEELKASGAI